MCDTKAIAHDIATLMTKYGFTQPLDPEFHNWYQKAKESMSKTRFPDNTLMPSGLTLKEERRITLRTKVREACARFHGVTLCQTKT